jgi:Leucine-rich repeat (LRR) protein
MVSVWICLLLGISRTVLAVTSLIEIQALHNLYNSTNGLFWNWRNESLYGSRWVFNSSSQADPCQDKMNTTWQGITCSLSPMLCVTQDCAILSISLDAFNLSGTLPTSLSAFHNLTALLLPSNSLTGSLPSQFFSFFTHLISLDLSSNFLTGSLPDLNLSSWHPLTYLSLTSNQLSGMFPLSFSSPHLAHLSLARNHFAGHIPSSLAQLTQLIFLSLSFNQFSGTIPPEIGSLTSLSLLFLFANQLTGPIPSELSALIHLLALPLHYNHLIGTIPSELSQLSKLVQFGADFNALEGTIPSVFSSLSSLVTLYLSNNLLVGSIPFELCSLVNLSVLYLNSNSLINTIPSAIGQLTKLRHLYFENNSLTGTLPSQLCLLSSLLSLHLGSNSFIGLIPTKIGSWTLLEELDLSKNHLTGPIPTSLTNLTKLIQLHLYKNQLSDTILFELNDFPFLEQCFLHQNKFIGHMGHFFSVSSSIALHPLINLDVSDNFFSGSIPSSIFFLTSLQTLSLSLNCFHHHIPSSICEAINVSVISMDGLGSATECHDRTTFPFTTVSLVQTMSGHIPNCVWLMSRLKVLNLAGNGLRGTIGSISSMDSLVSMTLSHNYLSGVIPHWLQVKKMTKLDLSHNKLSGGVNGFPNQDMKNFNLNRTLKLSVNRLSGQIFPSFSQYSTLDILSGNLFACRNRPHGDPNLEWQSCGSEEFDQSMILMAGVVIIPVFLMAFYFVCLFIVSKASSPSDSIDGGADSGDAGLLNTHLMWMERRLRDYQKLIQYVAYSHDLSQSLTTTTQFGLLLSELMRSVCILVSLVLLLGLPIYILKGMEILSTNEGQDYVTHSHLYRWIWTMAFLTGRLPAVILLMMMFVCLIYFCYFVNLLSKSSNTSLAPTMSLNQLPVPPLTQGDQTPQSLTLIIWMTILFNVSVIGAINGLYLWSTLQDLSRGTRIWIQFIFGFFSFLWNGIFLRKLFPNEIQKSKYEVWLLTCLTVINNVAIPCLIFLLSSPACYQVRLCCLLFCSFSPLLETSCPTQ